MEFRDYYKILGLERAATADEINKAYRRLARKYHPDVSKEPDAEARFKEMQEAYEVLKDPKKRAAYDQLGSEWKSGQQFRPPPDWGSGFEFSAPRPARPARAAGVALRRGRAGAGAAAQDGSFSQEEFSDFFSSLFGGGGRVRGRARRAPRAISTRASISISRRLTAARRARSS